MKYAIMSDVHANPQALEVALADAQEQGCERFLMLGDVTGYGYDAHKALTLVRKHFDVVLMGNHDSACLGRERSFSDRTNPNYDLDRRQGEILSQTALKWLGTRKFTRSADGMGLTHGNFIVPGHWFYIFSEEEAAENFNSRTEDLLFCGHTHRSAAYEQRSDGTVRNLTVWPRACLTRAETRVITRQKGCRYLVNVGSVGYPRNEHCSTYAICDPRGDSIVLRRLPFDFMGYVKALKRCEIDLPAWLEMVLPYGPERPKQEKGKKGKRE